MRDIVLYERDEFHFCSSITSSQGGDGQLTNSLDLNLLSAGLPAITPAFGAVLAEAGGVCLEDQGHDQGTQLTVQGHTSNNRALFWPRVTDQAARCWNDPEVATEHGAVGIAVLLAKQEIGFAVIERSRKGTGFDYWLGDENEGLFDNMARLEISGIRRGNKSALSTRINQKIKQTDVSDGCLPAYIVVVEFGSPVAEVRQK